MASTRNKSRSDPLWARVSVLFGALLMIFCGGGLVTIRFASAQLNSSLPTTSMIGGEAFAGANIDGALNVLLVGIDTEPSYTGPGSRGAILADTIIIAHIPESHDQAYLMSIPRDTRVDIPPAPKYGVDGVTDKINAAFSFAYQNTQGSERAKRAAGMDLLARTIYRLTGIKFNGGMLIDFDGFKNVLEELGGVDLCVDHRVRAIHLARDASGNVIPVWYDDTTSEIKGIPEGGQELWYEVGCRHYDAALALEYSRLRKGLPNGDYDRQRNQHKLIKAMVKKAMSMGIVTDLGKLDRIIDAGGKTMILDAGGKSVTDYLFTLKDVSVEDLVMLRTNAGTLNSLNIDGIEYEQLSPQSLELFESVRQERVQDFVLSHPEFLSTQ